MKLSEQAQRTLEQTVDAVTRSYAQGRPIDSLESTALPNRRKIIDALHHLEHVCFMGFYSAHVLDAMNLRHYIGEHLCCASEILVTQIARAVGYAHNAGKGPDASDFAWSENVVSEVFAQIPRLRDDLALDVQAAYQCDPAAKSIEEIIFSYPALQAITTHRFAHELYVRKVPMVPRILAEHAHSFTGIEIHPGARIGKRFFIDHGTGVVIGETSEIGDDVKLYQGVTLGALSMPRDANGELLRDAKRHPTLHSGVTIYAGATILGGDTVIGESSVIGSNTWITSSVPPNTRVSYSAYQAHATQKVESTPPPKKNGG
ncbi:MAG TPA: serine O-acetyltransferase EpsC [Polyangiales bacterium]